jgi:Uma2 family endonuclease
MVRKERKVTAAEYRLMPEDGPRHELIDGELVLMPSPVTAHQRALGRIFAKLTIHIEAHGLGEAFIAPLDVHLDEHNVLQPDLLFLSNERSDRAQRWIEGAPDLAVEVLSPSTESRDLGVKKELYVKHGVREYWIVDPDAETVEVHALERGTSTTLRAGDRLTSPLLPGLELDVAAIFA